MGEWPETMRSVVLPAHCDQFGHMNVRWYAAFFDDAAFHVWAVHGVTQAEMQACGVHTVSASQKIDFRREITAGELFVIRSVFTRVGTKSATFVQRMYNAERDMLHAEQRATEVFFDPATRASAPVPAPIRAKLESRLVTVE